MFDYVLVVRRVYQPPVRILLQMGLVVHVPDVVVLVPAAEAVELREGQQADAGRARLLPMLLLQLVFALHGGDGVVYADGVGRRTGDRGLVRRHAGYTGSHAQFRLDVHLELDGIVERGRAGRQSQIEIRVAAAAAAGRLVFPGPVMVHFIRDHAVTGTTGETGRLVASSPSLQRRRRSAAAAPYSILLVLLL